MNAARIDISKTSFLLCVLALMREYGTEKVKAEFGSAPFEGIDVPPVGCRMTAISQAAYSLMPVTAREANYKRSPFWDHLPKRIV